MKKVSLMLALVLAMSLFLTCAVAEEATLLAYYTFDDAEHLGTDASGNGNDLVKAVNPDGIQAVEGHVGGAVSFAGESGLLAADDSNNDLIDTYTGQSLTVSAWIKVDLEHARAGNARAISQGIQGSDEGFVLLVNKSENEEGAVSLYSISKVGGSSWDESYSAVEGDLDAWHHYVMVYDAEAELVTTFIDGIKIKEVYADAEEKLSSSFTFCVGGSWAQWDWFNGGNLEVTAEGFIGAVDEVKVIAGAVYDMDAIEAAK